MHLPRMDTRRERGTATGMRLHRSMRQSPLGEVALQVSWEITLHFLRRDLFFRSRCHSPTRQRSNQLLHREAPRHVLVYIHGLDSLRPTGCRDAS